METITEEQLAKWKFVLLKYKFALDEVNTKLKILNEEFQVLHDHNPIEHIKSRIKTPKSILEKMERKGLEFTYENAEAHIKDIAGIRIICSFVTDIYNIYEMIKKQDDIHVIQVKDYIANPKPNGYESFHLLISIPIFLTDRTIRVPVELQIRTIAMDFWASLEHKIYYKFDKDVPNELTAELKEAATAIHELDYKMNNIKEKMELFKLEEFRL